MKVLVTGGTGFVGREILRQLHESGHALRLLVRNPERRVTRELAGRCAADLRSGNVLEAGTLAGALAGCTRSYIWWVSSVRLASRLFRTFIPGQPRTW